MSSPPAKSSQAIAHRICPICEAGCGLKIDLRDEQILAISANNDDVFSTGHVCAKGLALTELHSDPDRLRTPLIRENGSFREASWEEAFAHINSRLSRILQDNVADSVATYIGNPTAHNIGLAQGMGVFMGALGSKNVFSAGTVDQIPKQLASELMFGDDMAIPVPDIARCDLLLMLGANPVVSNGSLWMVPNIRGHIRQLRARGGQLITVDPRRTETARLADDHLFIRPGTDAWLLAALINELRASGLEPSDQYALTGAQTLFAALEQVTLAAAACHTGIDQQQIQLLAQTICQAQHPVVYGRVGTTLQRFGTLTSFLIEVLNLLIGALDRAGGAVFPAQPLHTPSAPRAGTRHGRYRSRVSGYAEVLGQMPTAALAEEIETAGPGQIRALFCFAGNPVVSNADSERLQRALASLELLVCVDIYHTETSRLADVILPGTSPFEEAHYDHFLGAMGHRNVARYSPPLLSPSQPREWDLGLTLGWIAQHQSVPDAAQLRRFEDAVVAAAVARHVDDPHSGVYQRDVQDIFSAIEPEQGVERLLDLGVRAGPWGDHFGNRDGLTLMRMRETPDGIDLGAPQAGRLPEIVQHQDGRLDLAPQMILADLAQLLRSEEPAGLMLIGRRNPGSNNSWLRNLLMLGAGGRKDVLHMHPDDARAQLIEDGDRVSVRSATGCVQAMVTLTTDMAQGVVSLPHGFSEATDLAQQRVQPGPNYNVLARASDVDAPSGTAALNGIAVDVQPLLPDNS